MNRLKEFLSKHNYVNMIALLFVAVSLVPNFFLNLTEAFPPLTQTVNIMFPLGAYLLLTGLVKKPGKLILWLFPVIILNCFQIVLHFLYGESIIAIDMYLSCITSSPGEAGELLSNLLLPVIFAIGLYLPFIIWAIVTLWRKGKTLTSPRYRGYARYIGGAILSLSLIFILISQFTSVKISPRRAIFPINVISNIGGAAERFYDSSVYYSTSKDFDYQAETEKPDSVRRIIVMVIGETGRAGNWQLLGYNRETNPYLSQRNDLMLFPKAITQSNITHKCVPMMISPVTPYNFDSINNVKSIITAFRQAGYRTALFSNQPRNHSYTEWFGNEADTVAYLPNNRRYDHNLLDDYLVNEITNHRDSSQFIILHTYGSHFSYKDRYDKEDAHFKPDNYPNGIFRYKEQLVNAYDNSIRYIDRMLADLIEMVEAEDCQASIIYAADHGEDIFDDRRKRLTHASPVPTYYQLHVPMFVWMSQKMIDAYPEIAKNIASHTDEFVAPTQAIYPTLIELGSITTPYTQPQNALSSPAYKMPEKVYLNDYNEAIDLMSSGLKWEDFNKLNKVFGN